MLKNAIDSFSNAIKTGNPEDIINKMNLRKLIKDIERTNNLSFIEKSNNINNQIRQIYSQNQQMQNAIEELSANYNYIQAQKDEEINNLELQLNQLNLNIGNNNINSDLSGKVNINSINELTLDDGHINDNVNNLNLLNNQNIIRNINNGNMELNEIDQNDIKELNSNSDFTGEIGYNQEGIMNENPYMNNEEEIRELDDNFDNNNIMELN